MIPLKTTTVNAELDRSFRDFAERPAVRYQDLCWTYRDLQRHTEDAAQNLWEAGVRKGTHVGILCETCPDFLAAVFGTLRLGAVPVLFGTSIRREELKQLLVHCDVELLLIGGGHRDITYAEETEGLVPEVRELRDIRPVSAFTAPRRSAPDRYAPAEVRPEDKDFILFTSGTTQQAKAVLTNHYSRANNGLQQGGDLRLTPDDRVCVTMPVFHCFSLTVNILSPLFYGACICIPDSRHTGDVLSCIKANAVTVLSAVPAFLDALISREDFDEWDLSTLRTGFLGGSYCPPAMYKRFQSKLPYPILSSLGQTEATSGITTCFPEDSLEVRAGTIGHVMDHIEYEIRRGELCIRGYNVMQGYYNDPKATAKAIDPDGWLHTGDLCHDDGNGNLIIDGRIKENIIRGGENISARELEAVLENDPRVKECKAVGVPSAHYGEEVALCVIRNDGAALTEEELLDLYRSKVAYYKVPSYILFMKTFPKSKSGKVYLAYLKRICASQLELRD